jgi:hypothetical protein
MASFRGLPHAYDWQFDVGEDEFQDVFELRPVDEETFRLALEDRDIWLR